MTVQHFYDMTQKKSNLRKVELRLRGHDDEIAEVEFEEEDGQLFA